MQQHGHLIKTKNVIKNQKNNFIKFIVKQDKDDPLLTPAPSKYIINDISNKTPTWTIGNQKRDCVKVDSKTPGSGKYEYQTFIGEGPKYTMRQKFDENGLLEDKRKSNAPKKTKLPGPGHYDPKDSTGTPKYTIGQKHPKKEIKGLFRLSTPGVGKYELAKDFDAPCFKIGNEKRINLEINYSALKNPGPGKYNNNGIASTTPKWTFSKTERFGNRKPKSAFVRRLNVPGPGSYKMTTYMGKEGPHYTFNKVIYNHTDAVDESMFKKVMNYPSPQSYFKNRIYVTDTPIYSMSKLERNRPTSSDKYLLTTPGPEKYHPDKNVLSTMKHFPVWTMSKADEEKMAKNPKVKRVQTPGPGHYNYTNGNLPNGPKYSMRKKLKKKKKDNWPGPGKYEAISVHFQTEPKYSFGKEERKDDKLKIIIKDGFPGPNKYKPEDSKFNNVGNFTKDKRYKEPKFITPGPGQYKIPTAFDYLAEYTRQGGSFNPLYKYV